MCVIRLYSELVDATCRVHLFYVSICFIFNTYILVWMDWVLIYGRFESNESLFQPVEMRLHTYTADRSRMGGASHRSEKIEQWSRYSIRCNVRRVSNEISPRPCVLNPRPTGGGLFRAPPLVFLWYLLNQCRYLHQTCSTLSPNNFTHCVKILKSRVL